MSSVIVKRPARAFPPEMPSEELELASPPELQRGQDQGVMMMLLPMLAMGGSAAYFFMPGSQPIMKVMGGLMMTSMVAMGIAQVVRTRQGASGHMADSRRDYLKYLAQQRRKARKVADHQRSSQLYTHPAPDQLWALAAEGKRVWERRPGDDDFGQVRVGLAPQQLATPLVAPDTAPVDQLEPLTAHAMQRFIAAYGTVEGLPLAVSLRAFSHVALTGEPEAVYGQARAMIAQLSTLHSPADLVLGVAASPSALREWEWVKWLPHSQSLGELDGAGTRRLVVGDMGELEELLRGRIEDRPRFQRDATPLLDQPHVVVFVDGGTVPPTSVLASGEGLLGVTVVEMAPGETGEPRGDLWLRCTSEEMLLRSAAGGAYGGAPDRLSAIEAESLARQLAPLRPADGGEDEPLLSNLDFTDLMGIGEASSFDVARGWVPRSQHERLRVPIGVGEDGEPVHLDLKEAAQEGMGPHGLCVGATGSGKSELLRTLVLGLAVTHSSESLNFVLADFKGGATFAGMSEMPHVSAVITNLADDLTLVDRMRDSITGELQRRQELLKSTGNYANIHDYERARTAGAALEPLASLVLVIDEFSELLTAKPEFIDMFIQIGRIGRSLGVHLLLASQRLEEGRLRGLDTYLSYRIGLRTFSASESRAALGVPDAYHLPSVPGSGYLKFGTDTMVRFKAAYVSGPHRRGREAEADGGAQGGRRPAPFTAAPVAMSAPVVRPVAAQRDDAVADTVLDVLVRRLEGRGPEAHQVWLPPLDEAPSLDRLMPLAVSADRGLQASSGMPLGGLTVALGIVDKPFEQRRDPLTLDFSGAAGHGLIVGGPRSGKSTMLRTLVASFALTHTPSEVQFYCLDFGGGALRAVDGLAHVGGVAGRLEPDRVRRAVAEVAGVLARREEVFRSRGIDTVASYRRLRATGELPDEQWGDVFLLIDGWGAFKQDNERLEPVVADIAARGLGFGVHVVLTASRYMEVRAALKDQLLNRLELRLGDTMDSEINRKVAANVPAGVPGRGITPAQLHFMAGLPRIDGSSSSADLTEGGAGLVEAVNSAWRGAPAPGIRMLPTLLGAEQLPDGSRFPERGVAIGIDETALAPVFVNFETDPVLIIFGDSESGKTAALRHIARQISQRYTPQEAMLVVGDYRRTLLGSLPESHMLEYIAASAAMETHMTEVQKLVERRAPGPDVTPRQLRDRSWWSGPQLFVLIDDYELVAAGSNPMAQLADSLPFARDVGVRFIIARSSGGAGRSMYEPFMQRAKELAAQGLVLSGDPNEGELMASVRPRPMPPGRAIFAARRGGSRLVQLAWTAEG
ncbi:type VII secretion protein EccCa [Streptomyces cocklensis]|uniref:ESX secretion system protein EccC n=1 Tax=Actinacidiphila cocklensis TaxID=887465 RepID=A0A9W4DT64_9ACTN|nr:type VII secretion protein EccCa [Actinacidiphila cocklensis]MDD1060000.1 type VII secretion protein EccCa [Actinacidiphila cocklensis]WSX76454.1 type VII secretion protein EccCa [Streptomyces sp. NBC_00899]CAG6397274.1 ESX secretion system protein EccC [Actinacidiphila cocklensis]